MADFVNHLPLSNRARRDESHVTSDRRLALGAVVEQAATVLADAAVPEAARSTLAHAFITDARLAKDAALSPGVGSVSMLTEVARAVRAGRKRSIRALSHSVRAYLRLSTAVGHEPSLPPLTSGSVALYATTTAPLERRAVVAGHTLRATDADWEFGHGPTLEGPAVGIVAFLLGVSDVPPVAAPTKRGRTE
jgi:hypothetical protein